MNEENNSLQKIPPQVINYSPPVQELLIGLPGSNGVAIFAGIIGFVILLVMYILAREHMIYMPLALTLILFLTGLACFPALAQPIPKLKWNQDGITFPVASWSVFGFFRRKTWSDLKSIEFTTYYGANYAPKSMVLQFHGSKKLELHLDGFRKKDLEQFINSIRVFAPHVRFSPSLDTLKLGLGSNPKLISSDDDIPSHTDIWMGELNRRIAPTVFVPLDTGDILQNDRIEVIGQIATGGLSAIYLTRAKEFDLAILKESVLPPENEDDVHDKIIEMFKREAQVLSSLNHQRIVKVYDYFVESNRHYLLMEFIDGANLRTIVSERGPQPENVVFRWMEEMIEILSYLHSMSPPIVHRDFTPDNLILENDGSITLIDFGAANHCLTTVTGTIVGKTSFMPIEQFQGKPNKKSDIYSFAKTIYFLLSGQEPEPFTECDLLSSGVGVSRQLSDLVRTCTSKIENRPDIIQLKQEIETLKYIVNRHG